MGSEDFQFRSAMKNQFEETLFRLEEARYELDRHIDQNTSTMQLITQLLTECSELPPAEQDAFDFTPVLACMRHCLCVDCCDFRFMSVLEV